VRSLKNTETCSAVYEVMKRVRKKVFFWALERAIRYYSSSGSSRCGIMVRGLTSIASVHGHIGSATASISLLSLALHHTIFILLVGVLLYFGSLVYFYVL
jgi:hypothetical protein